MADDENSEGCQAFTSSGAESNQFESLSAANVQEERRENGLNTEVEDDEDKPKRKNRRPGTFWKKPPVKIYADNFGFGVNRYQCMIDYLDTKESGGRPKTSDLRLPFLEDRCLDRYSSRKPFRFYENNDIDHYIDTGHKIRDQIRQNDVVSPGNVLHRTHTNWSMTKKYVQLVKKSNVIDYRKLREEAAQNERGEVVPKVFKPCGVTLALKNMDPVNLTLMKAHNNLDHAIYMTSRRDRLSELDNQLEGVIGQLSDNVDDLNRRARKEASGRTRSTNLTPYDSAQNMGELAMITEDVAAKNRLRRQLDFQELEEGVDDIMRYDRSRNRIRSNLRLLDDNITQMEQDISSTHRRHRAERGDETELSVDVINAMAKKKARQALNLDVNDEDLDDPQLARLRMRRNHKEHEYLEDPAVTPFRRIYDRPDTVSDVQSRVMARAGELAGQTSTQRHINNRARHINIYVPRVNTADPDLIVKPSRTELNIDHMAKTLAAKGRIQRRFDVDDEGDLPVSGLNTYAYNEYNNRGAIKPVDQVPSNSLRVRSAVCRARQRNALAGR